MSRNGNECEGKREHCCIVATEGRSLSFRERWSPCCRWFLGRAWPDRNVVTSSVTWRHWLLARCSQADTTNAEQPTSEALPSTVSSTETASSTDFYETASLTEAPEGAAEATTTLDTFGRTGYHGFSWYGNSPIQHLPHSQIPQLETLSPTVASSIKSSDSVENTEAPSSPTTTTAGPSSPSGASASTDNVSAAGGLSTETAAGTTDTAYSTGPHP